MRWVITDRDGIDVTVEAEEYQAGGLFLEFFDVEDRTVFAIRADIVRSFHLEETPNAKS